MAGGTLKAFGAVFLIIGLLGLVGGLIAAVLGYTQETDNRDQGVFYDGQEGNVNQEMVKYGAIAAGAGLLLTIVGAILMAVGGAQSRRALEHAILVSRVPGTPQPTVTEAATAPVKERGPGAAIAGVVVALLLFGVVAAIAFGGFDDIVKSVGGSPNGEKPQPYAYSFNGTLVGAFTLLGSGSDAQGDNTGSFTPPTGQACMVGLEWASDATSPSALELEITVDGAVVVDESGPSGFQVTLPAATLGRDHQFGVYPSGNADLVPSLAFTLTVACSIPA